MKLIWITEDGDRFLGDSNSYGAKHKGNEPATLDNVTLADLCQYCDDEAEGANYHHFVGVHVKLAKLIEEKSNEAAAKGVMFAIATAGGLHEFN